MDIHIRNLKVQLPDQNLPLFRIQNLSIPHGQKILIQGPSGMGKTTLLHILAGLLTFAEGEVHLGQYSLEKMTDTEKSECRRKYIRLIFQRLNLFEHLTCLENLSFTYEETKIHQQEQALESVNLLHLKNKLAGQLSLGEQQRVAIARSLIQPSSFLFADEPTSSLDDLNTKKIMQALTEKSGSKTFICVSHDARIQPYFDRILDFQKVILS